MPLVSIEETETLQWKFSNKEMSTELEVMENLLYSNLSRYKLFVKSAFILLFQNWLQEFKKWLGSERLQVYGVSSDKKIEVSKYHKYWDKIKFSG